MKLGDMVKLAHYGTLVRKEVFEEQVVNKWGVGLITRVFPGGETRLRPHGLSKADWTQVEVFWALRDILKIEDIEAVEVIN
tara:strand:- start:677 stop:919 length:243 start_codon:yes stop_codon:yes gene_type:complete